MEYTSEEIETFKKVLLPYTQNAMLSSEELEMVVKEFIDLNRGQFKNLKLLQDYERLGPQENERNLEIKDIKQDIENIKTQIKTKIQHLIKLTEQVEQMPVAVPVSGALEEELSQMPFGQTISGVSTEELSQMPFAQPISGIRTSQNAETQSVSSNSEVESRTSQNAEMQSVSSNSEVESRTSQNAEMQSVSSNSQAESRTNSNTVNTGNQRKRGLRAFFQRFLRTNNTNRTRTTDNNAQADDARRNPQDEAGLAGVQQTSGSTVNQGNNPTSLSGLAPNISPSDRANSQRVRANSNNNRNQPSRSPSPRR